MSVVRANINEVKNAETRLDYVRSGLVSTRDELAGLLSQVDDMWESIGAEIGKSVIRQYIRDVKSIRKSVTEMKYFAEFVETQLQELDEKIDSISNERIRQTINNALKKQ